MQCEIPWCMFANDLVLDEENLEKVYNWLNECQPLKEKDLELLKMKQSMEEDSKKLNE